MIVHMKFNLVRTFICSDFGANFKKITFYSKTNLKKVENDNNFNYINYFLPSKRILLTYFHRNNFLISKYEGYNMHTQYTYTYIERVRKEYCNASHEYLKRRLHFIFGKFTRIFILCVQICANEHVLHS